MQQIKDVSTLTFTKARGGQFRWITISTLMLAIGTLLHLVSPSLAGFTPNWMIAAYCVAILLTKPSYKQCIGICMVAALLEVFTSKAGFPYGNFFSEFAGALVAGFFAHAVPPITIGKIEMRPVLSGFIATLVSGFVFVSLLKLVMGIPTNVYIFVILPAVFMVGIANAVITPFLYFPAKRLFENMSHNSSKFIEDSDHSALSLVQKQSGIISVEHFSYTYPEGGKEALHDINLHINKGDFIVVTGANGAGKTSLLMAMAGAIPQYYGGTMKGMVFTGGKAITQVGVADLASKVGVILAEYGAQIVTLTVEEEMAFALENHGFKAEEIRRRTKEALAKVRLSGLEKRKISTLSGGQKQRLVIAAVLAENPEVLVFDGLTSAKDPEGVVEFYELVGRLNKENGLTVVVAEHHLEAVLPYANKFTLMHEGQLLITDTPIAVMQYMDMHNIYTNAIPAIYKTQLELEKQGCFFKKDFINLRDAKEAINQSLEGGQLC